MPLNMDYFLAAKEAETNASRLAARDGRDVTWEYHAYRAVLAMLMAIFYSPPGA